MNRQIPILNRICSYKQMKRAWDIHEDKLKKLRGQIDQGQPSRYIFDKKKSNMSLRSVRQREIENGNRILLDKLTKPHTNLNHSQLAFQDFTQVIRERCRQNRARLLDKQNNVISRRLKNLRTNYPTEDYLKERSQNERYMNIRSKFPKDQHGRSIYNKMMWMKNSPDKYQTSMSSRSRYSSCSASVKCREVTFDRAFKRKLYRVEGCIRNHKVQIWIQNLNDERQRHDLSLEAKEGLRLIQKHFDSDFRKMLNCIEYDQKSKQFVIKVK